MDGRRRRYVPLSIRFATGRTGTRIQERFGLEGLAVWTALLAASKASGEQGTFEYAEGSEWRELGLIVAPQFSFEEFLVLLGQLKQTRRTRYGHVINVQLTHWEAWNHVIEREQAAARTARKRGGNTRDDKRTVGERKAGVARTEVEVEFEGERTPLPPFSRNSETGESGVCAECHVGAGFHSVECSQAKAPA